jgi:hypothetical protein
MSLLLWNYVQIFMVQMLNLCCELIYKEIALGMYVSHLLLSVCGNPVMSGNTSLSRSNNLWPLPNMVVSTNLESTH